MRFAGVIIAKRTVIFSCVLTIDPGGRATFCKSPIELLVSVAASLLSPVGDSW
jgi:hypothetical protein